MSPGLIKLGKDIEGNVASLSPEDLSTHLHVLGASGRGKSRLLQHMVRQFIKKKRGLCLIDPHGSLFEAIVKWCASSGFGERRIVHLIDPNNADWAVGLNPLQFDEDPRVLSRTVDSAVSACAQVWGGEDTSKTPLLRKCLRAVFFALAVNRLTLVEALELTSSSDPEQMRMRLTAILDDPIYQSVWDELNSLRPREFQEHFSSTNNRLIEFLSSPGIRTMLGAKEHAIDLRKCMDEGHIVLVNLQPKFISEDNGRLLGTLLLNSLMTTARQRDEKSAKKNPFYLVVDECYQFLGADIESMLDQSRKMGLHVILAHQRLSQLTAIGEHIYNAVMTNAQTKLVFGGMSDADSEVMAKELLRSEFDYNRPKEILNKPVVVGHHVEYHETTSQTESVASGKSSGAGQAMNASSGITQTILPDGSVSPMGLVQSGSGNSESSFQSNSSIRGNASTRGSVPMMMPDLMWLPTAVEGEAEILNRAILTISELPKRDFILKQPLSPSRRVTVPKVSDMYTLESRHNKFLTYSYEHSPYAVLVKQADAEIEARQSEFAPILLEDSNNPDDWKDERPWRPD